MPTFISTFKYTQQGIKDVGQTVKRAAALKAAGKKVGVKVKEVYWTLGEKDGVLIIEAPDDDSAMALVLQLGSLGNVQTTTCRAFTSSEMEQVLNKAHAQ